jgi:hypothetical protein
VRKVLTHGGAGFIHRTESPFEKDAASLLGAVEDEALVLGFMTIIADKLRGADTEKPGEFLHVPFLQAHGCDLAAVGADGAVGVFLDLFRNLDEAALDEAVGLQVAAQALVLGALLLAKTANLNKVGDQKVTPAFLKSPAR